MLASDQVRSNPKLRTRFSLLWGNDTAAHLIEEQTMAEKGAILLDLCFFTDLGASDWSAFGSRTDVLWHKNPQFQQHTQQFVWNTSGMVCLLYMAVTSL